MPSFYLDPGYGKNCTNVTNGNISCVESDKYNPYSNVAFTCLASGSTAPYFSVPCQGYTSLSSVSNQKGAWSGTKFSVYLDIQSDDSLTVSTPHGTKIVLTKNTVIGTPRVTLRSSGALSEASPATITSSLTPGFHNIVLSGSVYRNGYSHTIKVYFAVDEDSYTYDTTYSGTNRDYSFMYVLGSPLCFTLPTNPTDICYISNIVSACEFASTYSSVSEYWNKSGWGMLTQGLQLVRLPLSTPPVTDFTEGEDGEWIGTKNGQTLLQTIDASSVTSKYGDTREVIRLVAYGNPGYRTDSSITTAKGIQKFNDTITEGTITNLPTNTEANVSSTLYPPEDKILSAINGLQIGWQI